jgi:hypothetical protein
VFGAGAAASAARAASSPPVQLATGDALLAYNTGTRAAHLSMRGEIAVTYRPHGGSFSTPVVVDRELGGAPAVAPAPDGSGIVGA